MFLYEVFVVSYVVFKAARVCSIALANRSISSLIHLARWVKFNLWINPGLALIEVLRNWAPMFYVNQAQANCIAKPRKATDWPD